MVQWALSFIDGIGASSCSGRESAGPRCLPGATPTEPPTDFEAWANQILLRPEAPPIDENLGAVDQMAFFLSSPAFQRQ